MKEASSPAVDRARAGKENGGDQGPGELVRQQQQHMGTQTQLGIAAAAHDGQQGLAFLSPKLDTAIHGLVSKGGRCGNPYLEPSQLFLTRRLSLSLDCGAI